MQSAFAIYCESFSLENSVLISDISQQTGHIEPMLALCWPTFSGDDPVIKSELIASMYHAYWNYYC